MKLSELLQGLSAVPSDLDQEVKKLVNDSRQVDSSSVFVALKGVKFDSHTVLDQVCESSPLALIVEDEGKVPATYKGFVLKVENSRKCLDRLAGRWAGDPSKRLFCVGVTGTNGKTTLTHMVEWIFNQGGLPVGVMGTIDHHILDKKWKTELTTPGPLELQQRLKDFIDHGARAASLEVSSHALEQARADSVQFDVAVFTNLSRDHLDYHKDMESYFASKQSLFNKLLPQSSKKKKFAVINTDDSWGRRIQLPPGVARLSFGTQSGDFQFKLTSTSFEGMEAMLNTPKGLFELKLPMVGAYNLSNATAAIAVAYCAGIEVPKAIDALQKFPGVPGRLERVGNDKPYVFVDYAHTPDALQNVLEALMAVRKQAESQASIHCIFGCGGDRDPGKRALMGSIASRLADEVWVTSDNPRNEKPKKIMDDILIGIEDSGENLHIIEDRKLAISECISQALCGDVVLIAGKGHEDYQIIGDKKFPFSDFEIAQEALNAKTV